VTKFSFKNAKFRQKETGLYSDDVVLKLCRDHKIPHDEYKQRLFPVLEFAAKEYSFNKNGNDNHDLSVPRIKQQLIVISKAAEALAVRIEDFNEKAIGTLDMALFDMQADFIADKEEDNSEAAMREAEDCLYYDSFSMDAIGRNLNQIEAMCKTALANLKPVKGGRPANFPLFMWVKHVSDFWVRELKRPYTVDGSAGETVTKAGNFLTDCLYYLDPKATKLLYSQMRRYRDSHTQAHIKA
jgi:hypothetical protein